MSQENVADRSSDSPAVRPPATGWIEAAKDFELVTPRQNPEAGTYRGEAARRWSMAWRDPSKISTLESAEVDPRWAMKSLSKSCNQAVRRGSQAVVEERRGRW